MIIEVETTSGEEGQVLLECGGPGRAVSLTLSGASLSFNVDNVDDATGRYLRMDLVEAMQDGNVRNYFGLCKAGIRGLYIIPGYGFEEDFSGQFNGSRPAG